MFSPYTLCISFLYTCIIFYKFLFISFIYYLFTTTREIPLNRTNEAILDLIRVIPEVNLED